MRSAGVSPDIASHSDAQPARDGTARDSAVGVDPAALLDGIVPSSDPADIVLFFAGSVAAVHTRVDGVWVDEFVGGRLWVGYRKGATARKAGAQDPAAPPLHRDTLQQALAEHGLTGVTLIALDAEWSALRVRPL